MSLMTGRPPQVLTLRQLANKKAAMTRHFGSDDARTLEAAAQLRYALLAQAIREAARSLPPLSPAEKAGLIALLSAA
jgi:hypothetical protein